MKISTIFACTVVMCMITMSCSSKYDDAITNYIQTNNKAKLDLGLNIKETKNIRTITVADSVAYLTQKSEIEKQADIASIESEIAQYQEVIVSGVNGLKPNKTLSEAYLSEIDKAKARIDSLKALPTTVISKYEGRKASDILALIVAVTYEVENPTKETITSDFLLSEDGKTCFGITENRDLIPEK